MAGAPSLINRFGLAALRRMSNHSQNPNPQLKPDGLLRHFILAFVLAAFCYAIFYFGIEHRRNQKGPWQVMFTNSATGMPAIIVDQATIGVTNVQIAFPGEILPPITNSPATSMVQQFARPYPVPFAVPFGKCLFMDTTFLPGTITFELFGHEVELLPRVLIIDYQEHPWQSGTTITVTAAGKTNAPPRKPQ